MTGGSSYVRSLPVPDSDSSNRLLRFGVCAALLCGCVAGSANIASAQHLKHLWLLVSIYAALVTLLFWRAFFIPLRPVTVRVLRNGLLMTGLLLVLAAADLHHYASIRSKPHPQTSQLALAMPAEALAHGHNPYHVQLPENAPVSPGPGWIALVTPLVMLHAGAAVGAVALAVAVVVLRKRDRAGGGMLCVLMLAQPHVQSQLANGGDLYAIMLLLGSWIILLLDSEWSQNTLLLLACAGGVLATARMALLPIVLVPCFALYRKGRRDGLIAAAGVTCTALMLDLGCAWWTHAEQDEFQPLHIFNRGGAALLPSMKALLLMLLAATALYLVRYLRGRVNDALLGVALALTALFVPVGIGELVSFRYDLSWEGCNYLSLPLPLLAMWLVRTRPREILGDGNVQTHPS